MPECRSAGVRSEACAGFQIAIGHLALEHSSRLLAAQQSATDVGAAVAELVGHVGWCAAATQAVGAVVLTARFFRTQQRTSTASQAPHCSCHRCSDQHNNRPRPTSGRRNDTGDSERTGLKHGCSFATNLGTRACGKSPTPKTQCTGVVHAGTPEEGKEWAGGCVRPALRASVFTTICRPRSSRSRGVESRMTRSRDRGNAGAGETIWHRKRLKWRQAVGEEQCRIRRSGAITVALSRQVERMPHWPSALTSRQRSTRTFGKSVDSSNR